MNVLQLFKCIEYVNKLCGHYVLLWGNGGKLRRVELERFLAHEPYVDDMEIMVISSPSHEWCIPLHVPGHRYVKGAPHRNTLGSTIYGNVVTF